MNQVFVLLLGGEGKRLEKALGVRKQFYAPRGKELFLYPYETAKKSGLFDSYVFVASEEDFGHVRSLIPEADPVELAPAGASRNDSVRSALKRIEEKGGAKTVYIHDADRVFLSLSLLRRIDEALRKAEAVTPVLPVKDSLLRKEDGVLTYPGREGLYQVQTPQAFDFETIDGLYRQGFRETDTDDFSKALRAGKKVALVEGESLDFKLTDPSDLSLLSALLPNPGSADR